MQHTAAVCLCRHNPYPARAHTYAVLCFFPNVCYIMGQRKLYTYILSQNIFSTVFCKHLEQGNAAVTPRSKFRRCFAKSQPAEILAKLRQPLSLIWYWYLAVGLDHGTSQTTPCVLCAQHHWDARNATESRGSSAVAGSWIKRACKHLWASRQRASFSRCFFDPTIGQGALSTAEPIAPTKPLDKTPLAHTIFDRSHHAIRKKNHKISYQ